MQFSDFFQRATGFSPHAYQTRLALEGLPDLLQVPMGAGKSKAVVLAWLWRRLYAAPDVRTATPRRLVVALPMRTLVDQFEHDVVKCLAALELTDRVGLYVVMGGRRSGEKLWRTEAHQPSIMIGTIDCLVSKALNRGFGISRNAYPVDFALMTNGAHIVIDEVQLAAASTVTLRQLAGFRRSFPVAEPSGLTCMSATVDRRLINTVDNPDDGLVTIALAEADRRGHLGDILAATKNVRRLLADGPVDAHSVATHALRRHRPGTRTLVVVNTVKAAKLIFKALQRAKPTAELMLIHSRFRGVERVQLSDRLTAPLPDSGMIVVATQVIEAGVDLDSSVMITESAPWASLCQRSGRCNRSAQVEAAELWWFTGPSDGPYAPEDLIETERVLTALEGSPVTGETLLSQQVAPGDLQVSVLRRPDFLALFDTAPDLSGVDVDVSRYIREGKDTLDCQVAWVALAPGEAPNSRNPLPDQALRCPVPVNDARSWAKTVDAWTLNVVTERWERVRAQTRVRPGEVILAAASTGGYDPALGFEAGSTAPVPVGQQIAVGSTLGAEEPDVHSLDATNLGARDWVLLDDHLRAARDQAAALLVALAPEFDDELQGAVIAAALTHDLGKLNEEWQQGLKAAAPQLTAPDGVLAKSPGRGRLRAPGRPGFRHELQSALLLGAPQSAGLRAAAGVTDDALSLVQYLVAAHHGKVRLQVRQPSDSVRPGDGLLGLFDGDEMGPSSALGVDVDPWSVDLGVLSFGGEQSWTRSALDLLETYGPFRLAYLEMVVRVADWRASAGLAIGVPGDEQ